MNKTIVRNLLNSQPYTSWYESEEIEVFVGR